MKGYFLEIEVCLGYGCDSCRVGGNRVKRIIKRTYWYQMICLMLSLITLLGGVYWSDGKVYAAQDQTMEQFRVELDQLVPQLQDKYGVPGVAIGIIHNGKAAYNLSYGYANLQDKQVITPNTNFQAASISKSLTAWGIMKLVEQGKLDLNQPIDHYLTRWHLPTSTFDPSEVTIERILSHTAGLGVGGYYGSASQTLPTLEQSLAGAGLFNKPVTVVSEPGTKSIYSGGGYTILQLIIEEVTGMSFQTYMQEQVLEPLGMRDSSFQPSFVANQMATPYGYFNNPLPEYQFTEQAAAGLYTTAQDMMKFMIAGMHLGNTGTETKNNFMSDDLIHNMQEPILGDNALGVFVSTLSNGKHLLYHPGDNRGFYSFYGYIPTTGEGFVILTNSENGFELRNDIYNQWIEFVTGELPPDYYAMTSQRNIYVVIAVIMGILLGLYLLLFVKKCVQGDRGFITQHTIHRYMWVTFRTGILLCIGVALYLIGYQWTLLPLNLGKKYIFILTMSWLAALIFVGFFPKRKKNVKESETATF